MANRSSNKAAVPEAKGALDKFKFAQISLSFNQSFLTKIRSVSISSPCHFHFVL